MPRMSVSLVHSCTLGLWDRVSSKWLPYLQPHFSCSTDNTAHWVQVNEVNLKPPSVIWNKLQLPLTIKFFVIWFTVIISEHLFIHTQSLWSINPSIFSPTEGCFSMRTREVLSSLHLNLGTIDALVWRFSNIIFLCHFRVGSLSRLPGLLFPLHSTTRLTSLH